MTRILFALAFALRCAFAAAPESYDLVIEHGHIIDGTGSPWYAGDIGISNGHIAAIGALASAAARQRIDAHGLVVAPGFIDMLGQSEASILVNSHVPSKIFQGITSEITGEGNSIAPLNAQLLAGYRAELAPYQVVPDWHTFAEYFARLERPGIGINLASYVGATQLRRLIMGEGNRAPTAAELDEMKTLVRQAMEDGAVGVSSALQ
ncbi:MAG: hypothetical protein JO091_13225, partial [Acidobacteriaceae bacterium]|nr:hypothetical protein [Acidobacteriaceae bacterium]